MSGYLRRGCLLSAVMAAVLMLASVNMHMDYPEVFKSISDKIDTVVVLDAGHGGYDPGKIGVTGSKEKDINLAITMKVKKNLEHQGITVILTRDGDFSLNKENSQNKKKDDMRERMRIINQSGAVLAVSIHQNSFSDSRYDGAQVFYLQGSPEGQKLAAMIQQSFVTYADPDNSRQEKANSDYYLLKNAEIPMVIAECGFLSNAEEEARLADDDYQEKAAWAVYMGIIRYLNRE